MRIEVTDADMVKFIRSLEYGINALAKDTHRWDDYVKKHPDAGGFPRNADEEYDYYKQIRAREAKEYAEKLVYEVKYRNTVNAYYHR